MNTRHEITVDDVIESICNNTARHKRIFERKKADYLLGYEALEKMGAVDDMLTPEQKNKELEQIYLIGFNMENVHYSTVRIIEIPEKPRNVFMLVYGGVIDHEAVIGDGTGLFDNYEDARKWFMGGGR